MKRLAHGFIISDSFAVPALIVVAVIAGMVLFVRSRDNMKPRGQNSGVSHWFGSLAAQFVILAVLVGCAWLAEVGYGDMFADFATRLDSAFATVRAGWSALR